MNTTAREPSSETFTTTQDAATSPAGHAHGVATPTPTSIGFLGGGRVARILLGGWARAGAVPASVTVVDPDSAALRNLTSAFPTIHAGNLTEVATSDIVFIAVPPSAAADAISRLRDLVAPETLVVSLVPTLSIARVAQVLGADHPIARVIPNAPSIVGAGVNPMAFSTGVPDASRAVLLAVLAPLGQSPVVPDEQLAAYAVLTAMGPTYLWPQLYALLDVATRTGLDPEAALGALAAMVRGTLTTMTDAGLAPDEVQDLIPSRPLADPVAAMSAAYSEVLIALHTRLTT